MGKADKIISPGNTSGLSQITSFRRREFQQQAEALPAEKLVEGEGASNLVLEGSELQQSTDTVVYEIPIAQLHDNPKNGRRKYKEADIERLAESITDAGFRGVIEVIPHPEKIGDFQLIYGHQRKRAAMHAGKTKMPCIIVKEKSLVSRKTSFYENFIRSDISKIEQALELQAMKDDFDDVKNVELGKMTGMCETEVSRFLKLLDLPADVQGLIDSGDLSYAHARAFIPMLKQEGGAERISFLAVKIVKNDWTTRDLNRYLKAQEKQAPILETQDAPEVLAKIEVISSMEEKLKSQFQSTVDIKPSKNKGGKIVLNYASDEELHRLFELLNK